MSIRPSLSRREREYFTRSKQHGIAAFSRPTSKRKMTTHILNRILPMALRKKLRHAALATIPSMRHLDMPRRLRRLPVLGFLPQTIVDVGSAKGEWARLAADVWPNASIYGFEPNHSNRDKLERTKAELRHFDFTLAFLGAARGEAVYTDQEDQTSLLDGATNAKGNQRAPMLTLDEWALERKVSRIDFLKMDVQGYELEVLKGATRMLPACQAVLLEVSFFSFLPNVPLFDEVIAFMKTRGFVAYDVLGILRRQSDDALAQMDFLFLREGHPLLPTGLDDATSPASGKPPYEIGA